MWKVKSQFSMPFFTAKSVIFQIYIYRYYTHTDDTLMLLNFENRVNKVKHLLNFNVVTIFLTFREKELNVFYPSVYYLNLK